MPAQVVVVRRSRRSLFAAPRALPDWLRAVWAAFSLKSPAAELDSHPPVTPTILAPAFPRLVRDVDGAHRCTGCGACVRICPSRCLELDTGGGEGASSITRFELSAGACIGCGLCIEICPEDALAQAIAADAASGLRANRIPKCDLLVARE